MCRPRALALSAVTAAMALALALPLAGCGPAPARPPLYRGPAPTITVTAIPSKSVIGP